MMPVHPQLTVHHTMPSHTMSHTTDPAMPHTCTIPSAISLSTVLSLFSTSGARCSPKSLWNLADKARLVSPPLQGGPALPVPLGRPASLCDGPTLSWLASF